MANEIKGEFTLDVKVDGAKQTLTLMLDVNALCQAEAMLSMTSAEIVTRIGSGSMGLLRTMLWVATRANHDALTVDECGDLITDATPNVVAATLLIGLNKTFPAPKKAGGDSARPTRGRTARETATA